jgi:gas vesicle protein
LETDKLEYWDKGGNMHLTVSGLLKIDGQGGDGLILLTNRSAFFFRPINSAARKGAMVGGLIGALIGSLIDKKKSGKMELEHLNDPEIQELDEKSKKMVSQAKLIKKLQISALQKISTTKMGCKFMWPGEEVIDYKGMIHKKKISSFLRDLGVLIE